MPTVYPRPRGGALMVIELCEIARAPGRSIPAHAGEPHGAIRKSEPERSDTGLSPPTRGSRVPLRLGPIPLRILGLSPPTRGSRGCDWPIPHRSGSIPAHAGEPTSDATANRLPRGSIPAHAGEPGAGCTSAVCTEGSIPAHAGEPTFSSPPPAHAHGLSRPRGGAP